MIVVRDVFSLKFGKARDAKALMEEAKKFMSAEELKNNRVLFDLMGPAYTMVMEFTCKNLTDWEDQMSKGFSHPGWRDWYQKFIPIVEKSYREVFTIQE